jgi:hypothetical protein
MYLKMLIQLNRNHNLFMLINHLVSEDVLSNFILTICFCLVPNEYLNELEGVLHFERVFQDRHPNVHRWPIWFKSSLENAINQSVKYSFFRFLFIHLSLAWSICCFSKS